MKTTRAMLKRRVSIPIILCGIMLFWSFAALGEEWTEAQKEVLSVLEKRREKIKEGDYNFLEAGLHDDALIWLYDINVPLRKDSIMTDYGRWIKHARPVTYESKIYAVQIFGDIANVMGASRWKAEKKRFSGYGRALITLKKEDGTWLIISQLDASCENLINCSDW